MQSNRRERDPRGMGVFEPVEDRDERIDCPEGKDGIKDPRHDSTPRDSSDMQIRQERRRRGEGLKRLVGH